MADECEDVSEMDQGLRRTRNMTGWKYLLRVLLLAARQLRNSGRPGLRLHFAEVHRKVRREVPRYNLEPSSATQHGAPPVSGVIQCTGMCCSGSQYTLASSSGVIPTCSGSVLAFVAQWNPGEALGDPVLKSWGGQSSVSLHCDLVVTDLVGSGIRGL